MFTIGEFARLGSVTVRALRHYDQIGLLGPSRIDESTGYRYYAAAQLAPLNRIVALQRLGFSLKEIEELLGAATADQIRGVLMLRKSQVEEDLAAQRSTLSEIEFRLRAIERETAMPNLDVRIKSLPRQRFAAIGALVPGFGPSNTYEILVESAATLEHCLGEAQVEPIGYWFICFDRTADDEIIAFFCLPIADFVTSLPEPAGIYELDPVEESLSLVREIKEIADYSNIYQDLAVWAETNGYVLVGDGRDLSLDGNGEGTGLVMETQWPLRRPDAPVPPVAPRRIG